MKRILIDQRYCISTVGVGDQATHGPLANKSQADWEMDDFGGGLTYYDLIIDQWHRVIAVFNVLFYFPMITITKALGSRYRPLVDGIIE